MAASTRRTASDSDTRIQTRASPICGVVRVKVLRGVIRAEQKARLEDLFDLLDDISTDARAWVEATDLPWELDRRGLVIPLSDLVIAACARRVRRL